MPKNLRLFNWVKFIFRKKGGGSSQQVFLNNSGGYNKYKRKFIKSKLLIFFRKVIIWGSVVIIVLFLLFTILDFVFYLKTQKSFGIVRIVSSNIKTRPKEKIELVKGLGDYKIYSYPNSVFIFEGANLANKDKQQVNLFLAHGNSVYLLPANKEFNQIKDEYKRQLEKAGWKFIGEKKLTDENGFAGLYFEKNDTGLRIYTISNYDIWYEILNKHDAKTFLKERILSIYSKQQALSNDSNKLPEKYKLYLSVPNGYRYEGFKLPELEAYMVTFFNKTGEMVLRVVPYKRQFLQVDKLKLKSFAMEYLEDTNRILNLSEGTHFEEVKFFNIFDKDKYIPLALLIQKSDTAKIPDSYKSADWYRLRYTDVNGDNHVLYIKQYKYTIWILDVL